MGQGLSVSALQGLVSQYNADVEARTRRVTNPDGSVTIVRPRTPFNQIISPIALAGEVLQRRQLSDAGRALDEDASK